MNKNAETKSSGYGKIAVSYKDGKHSISKESLVEFEKTWGHRVLMGVSIAMLFLAVLIILYSSLALGGLFGMKDVETTQFLATIASMFYITAIIAAALMIPPAIIGIVVSKHPKNVILAYIFAIIAIALVVLLVIYVVASKEFTFFSLASYAFLLLVLPVIYLVASIKIGKSNKVAKGATPVSATPANGAVTVKPAAAKDGIPAVSAAPVKDAEPVKRAPGASAVNAASAANAAPVDAISTKSATKSQTGN